MGPPVLRRQELWEIERNLLQLGMRKLSVKGKPSVSTTAMAQLGSNVERHQTERLATGPEASRAQTQTDNIAASPEPSTPPSPSGQRGARQIVAEVYDYRDDAQTEASLHRALLREISKTAKELAGVSLTDQQAERELVWLRKHPLVEEKVSHAEETDALGRQRISKRITLNLPPTVVEEWSQRLQASRYAHYWGYLYGTSGTLGIWLVGLLLLAKLDRWTGGYRRGAIIFFGGGILLALTVALWLSVYIAYLA
ncbi:hypothetical protein HRbin36_01517 [bacterium HR36]|nr:hypothetical protein HRbin36_01517 [bacterium HR36]